MTNTKPIEFEEGSSNVFADLGLPNADELLVRAQIGFHVATLIKNRGLKQQEAADILGVKQPYISHIMNGHFSKFTTDKLLEFLKRLDQKVIITISPHYQGEPYQQVSLAK